MYKTVQFPCSSVAKKKDYVELDHTQHFIERYSPLILRSIQSV